MGPHVAYLPCHGSDLQNDKSMRRMPDVAACGGYLVGRALNFAAEKRESIDEEGPSSQVNAIREACLCGCHCFWFGIGLVTPAGFSLEIGAKTLEELGFEVLWTSGSRVWRMGLAQVMLKVGHAALGS